MNFRTAGEPTMESFYHCQYLSSAWICISTECTFSFCLYSALIYCCIWVNAASYPAKYQAMKCSNTAQTTANCMLNCAFSCWLGRSCIERMHFRLCAFRIVISVLFGQVCFANLVFEYFSTVVMLVMDCDRRHML